MIDCVLISHLVEQAGEPFNHKLYQDIEALLAVHGLVYDTKEDAWSRPKFIGGYGECKDYYDGIV